MTLHPKPHRAIPVCIPHLQCTRKIGTGGEIRRDTSGKPRQPFCITMWMSPDSLKSVVILIEHNVRIKITALFVHGLRKRNEASRPRLNALYAGHIKFSLKPRSLDHKGVKHVSTMHGLAVTCGHGRSLPSSKTNSSIALKSALLDREAARIVKSIADLMHSKAKGLTRFSESDPYDRRGGRFYLSKTQWTGELKP